MVKKEVLVSFLKFPGIVMGHTMTNITLSGNIAPKVVLGGLMVDFGKKKTKILEFFQIHQGTSWHVTDIDTHYSSSQNSSNKLISVLGVI